MLIERDLQFHIKSNNITENLSFNIVDLCKGLYLVFGRHETTDIMKDSNKYKIFLSNKLILNKNERKK